MRVGILINDKSIKIAKVRDGRPVLLKVPLEQGILQDGFIKDKEKLKGTLLKLIRQLGLSKAEFVLGIAEKHIFSKTLTIANHGNGLEEKIKEELESLVPAEGETYTNWQVLEKSDNQERIFIASVQKSFIGPYLELFGLIGVMLVGIEPVAFALSRHIPKELPPPKKEGSQPAEESPLGATLLIACEETEILLTIVNKNGGIEFTSVFSPEIAGRRDEFLAEVGNIRMFYDHKNAAEKITRVYITGEGASEEMKNQISTSLSIPVQLLYVGKGTDQNSLIFFPVFALSDLPFDLSQNHMHINLVPQNLLLLQEKTKKERKIENIFQKGAIFLGILCLFYILILGFLFLTIQTTSAQIQKEKDNLKANKTSSLPEKVNEVNKNIALVKKFMTKKEPILDTLSFLADKTPGGIVVTQYKIDALNVALSGKSLDRETLIAFEQILEGDDRFQNVHIPLTSLEKKGASQFSLSFELAK